MSMMPPTVCAIILGATFGIVVHHKYQTKTQKQIVGSAVTLNSSTNRGSFEGSPLTQSAGTNSANQRTLNTAEFHNQAESVYIKELREQIEALKEQNAQLSNRQIEINDELHAMQFRLDSHSSSFRPLRTELNKSEPSNGNFISPSRVNPLLPPRNP